MMRLVVSFLAGALFAVGLIVSGMTLPAKVSGFLDLGAWDPSLAFVMVGAIGVNFIGRRLVLRRGAPIFQSQFDEPKPGPIDARLIAGAAIFGVGWALSGYCPGPAIVTAGTGSSGAIVFTVAMAAGMFLHRVWSARRTGDSFATTPRVQPDG